MSHVTSAAICLTLACALTISARATTIIVSNTNDNGLGSLRQALANATVDAETKARAIAAAAGVGLAGVFSITESSVSVPRPVADTAALRAAPAAGNVAPTPVEGGELVVRARVQASYRI